VVHASKPEILCCSRQVRLYPKGVCYLARHPTAGGCHSNLKVAVVCSGVLSACVSSGTLLLHTGPRRFKRISGVHQNFNVPHQHRIHFQAHADWFDHVLGAHRIGVRSLGGTGCGCRQLERQESAWSVGLVGKSIDWFARLLVGHRDHGFVGCIRAMALFKILAHRCLDRRMTKRAFP
jgi:hypothetical protein